jgi:hypothetical protein
MSWRVSGGTDLGAAQFAVVDFCRLYLSMMDKMNVRLPKFGDATLPLEEV